MCSIQIASTDLEKSSEFRYDKGYSAKWNFKNFQNFI